jgi:transposase-like protein
VTLFATVDRLAEAEHQLAELFGPNVRQRTIARTADALLPKILSWRNRALGVAYPVLLLDTILTARERAIGAAIGIDLHGNRDLLGLWPLTGADHERPAWQPVATDLRLRGLNHVAIVCCDELTISTSAVRQSWPFAELRSSIMDVISNSLREQLMTR